MGKYSRGSWLRPLSKLLLLSLILINFEVSALKVHQNKTLAKNKTTGA